MVYRPIIRGYKAKGVFLSAGKEDGVGMETEESEFLKADKKETIGVLEAE